VTVKTALTVPLSPSVTVTLFTDSVGSGSSSVIVPRPSPSPIVAFVGLVRPSVRVSSASSSVSPTTGTMTCLVVCPGVNVSVPEVAV
jgi:hypothetical protein